LGLWVGWRTDSLACLANMGNEKTPALVRTGLWRTRYGALALTKKESDQLGHGSDATEPMAGRATVGGVKQSKKVRVELGLWMKSPIKSRLRRLVWCGSRRSPRSMGNPMRSSIG
jgi:hypothetical protein